MPPDEIALRADLESARYLAGQDRRRWKLQRLQWPFAYFDVFAKDARPYTLRLNCEGFPSQPPTGTFWDMNTDGRLSSEKWPKGGQRIALALRPDWQSGNALYIPCDRVTLNGHADWATQYPQLLWKPMRGISHYLEVVHELLQSEGYVCAPA